MDNQIDVPQGQFQLNRLPHNRRDPLRAWDAADEYLLKHIADEIKPEIGDRILIINDSFGALAVALSNHQPCALSDSYLSQEATRKNLKLNGIAEENVELISSMEVPHGDFELILIKAPKSLALLEDELIRIRPLIKTGSQLIVAGMIKGLAPGVWKLLERIIGPTTTSLARKKARLIFTSPDSELRQTESPYPTCYTLEQSNYQICNHANVFSRESLDIGTRLFLKHIPTSALAKDIVDLGCGNGVVGLIASERNPEATIHFIDESHMAIASARDNFNRAFGMQRPATYEIEDGLTKMSDNSVDLILCNPPFHQQSAVGTHLAQQMFNDSKRVLRDSGELWVIGNRHLGYHKSLKQLFGNVTLIDSNKKFVVLKSIKI
ncbi:MAG: methyltransferase [Gammaproteobacteria bacterium]|nr:methyltransferase [Gammaproteobacteria bacterium]